MYKIGRVQIYNQAKDIERVSLGVEFGWGLWGHLEFQVGPIVIYIILWDRSD